MPDMEFLTASPPPPPPPPPLPFLSATITMSITDGKGATGTIKRVRLHGNPDIDRVGSVAGGLGN